jgi:hypothetical protein
MTEVTCGDVGLQGVKVIVPSKRFDRLVERLGEVEKDRKLFTFLASRCSAAFLSLYLQRNPEIGDVLCTPNSYLSMSAKVALLVRLQTTSLLPEEWRRQFVARAADLAIETPDLDSLSDAHVRGLFTTGELAALRNRVRNELVPSLGGIAEDWGENCDDDEDPEEHFSPLRDVLSVLGKEFAGDAGVGVTIHEADKVIDSAIQNILEDRPEEPDDREYDYYTQTSQQSEGDRSVFDDIDE